MDCQTVRAIFDPTSPTVEAVAEHLRQCPSCQQYADEMRRIHYWLASDPPVAVSADFNARLRQRIAQAHQPPLPWWPLVNLKYALPIAAMVVVAMTVLMTGNRSRDESPPISSSPVAQVTAPPEGATWPPRDSASASLSQSDEAVSPPAAVEPLMTLEPAPTSPHPVDYSAQRVGWDEARRVSMEPPQVILRIRDELTRQERLVTIPSVVFGAEPVFMPTRSVALDLETVY